RARWAPSDRIRWRTPTPTRASSNATTIETMSRRLRRAFGSGRAPGAANSGMGTPPAIKSGVRLIIAGGRRGASVIPPGPAPGSGASSGAPCSYNAPVADAPVPRADSGHDAEPPTLMNPFDTASPLDARYYLADRDFFQRLRPYVSEGAQVKYLARVEAALAQVLADHG